MAQLKTPPAFDDFLIRAGDVQRADLLDVDQDVAVAGVMSQGDQSRMGSCGPRTECGDLVRVHNPCGFVVNRHGEWRREFSRLIQVKLDVGGRQAQGEELRQTLVVLTCPCGQVAQGLVDVVNALGVLDGAQFKLSGGNFQGRHADSLPDLAAPPLLETTNAQDTQDRGSQKTPNAAYGASRGLNEPWNHAVGRRPRRNFQPGTGLGKDTQASWCFLRSGFTDGVSPRNVTASGSSKDGPGSGACALKVFLVSIKLKNWDAPAQQVA